MRSPYPATARAIHGARAAAGVRAVGFSLQDLCDSLEAVARGRRGASPASVAVLSGDVHHGYLARVRFGDGDHAPVWQAVCSPFRKELAGLARLTRAPRRPARWRPARRALWDNQIGMLALDGDRASVTIATTAGDWRAPHLRSADPVELT